MMTEYLYGLPGAEYMQDDPCATYEQWLDDQYETENLAASVGELRIEQWTSSPPEIMSRDTILDYISESFSDEAVFEEAAEAVNNACGDAEVIAVFDAARDLLHSKIVGFRLADEHVSDLIVTWDAETGEPLLDGEPMYHKHEEAET